MARYRTVKPELFADEKLLECSIDARFLFIGLLPFVDDMGRRQYSPRRIKAEVFPADYEFTHEVVEGLVQELASTGIIELYDIRGKSYLRIPNFLRHQNINRPGHCYVPPSPAEGPGAIRCLCANCKYSNGKVRNRRTFLQEHTEYSVNTHGAFSEDSVNDHGPLPEYAPQEGKGVKPIQSREDYIHTGAHSEPIQPQTQAGDTSELAGENRRTEHDEVDKIASEMLRLLGITSKPLIMQALTASIKRKATAHDTSLELAGQRILARAAHLIAEETVPEDWEQWFFDARYDYVNEGDRRTRHTRTVCGGSLCSEGWEPITVNGSQRVLRRCPDCVRAWRESGEG